MFYVNFVKLCNSTGKSPSAVAEEIGVKRSTVTRWKQGKSITDANLQKVADYFGLSVDDLTKEMKIKKSPAPEGAEHIPGYSKLSDTNRAIVDSMIAQLLAAQSEG